MIHRIFIRRVGALNRAAPFRPYVVVLTTREEYAVGHPEALMVKLRGSCKFVAPSGTHHYFTADTVAEVYLQPRSHTG